MKRIFLSARPNPIDRNRTLKGILNSRPTMEREVSRFQHLSCAHRLRLQWHGRVARSTTLRTTRRALWVEAVRKPSFFFCCACYRPCIRRWVKITLATSPRSSSDPESPTSRGQRWSADRSREAAGFPLSSYLALSSVPCLWFVGCQVPSRRPYLSLGNFRPTRVRILAGPRLKPQRDPAGICKSAGRPHQSSILDRFSQSNHDSWVASKRLTQMPHESATNCELCGS